MPVAEHRIVFARIVPSELNLVTTENNNIIDLALCSQIRDPKTGSDIWQNKLNQTKVLSWNSFVSNF